MQDDFNSGRVTYLLLEDASNHGYVRILDTNEEENDDERVGLVDIVIPRDLGDNLEELAEYAREQGWGTLYLNAEIPWISEYCDGAERVSTSVDVPDLNVLRHFADGSGEYNSLVDLLQMYE